MDYNQFGSTVRRYDRMTELAKNLLTEQRIKFHDVEVLSIGLLLFNLVVEQPKHKTILEQFIVNDHPQLMREDNEDIAVCKALRDLVRKNPQLLTEGL